MIEETRNGSQKVKGKFYQIFDSLPLLNRINERERGK